MQVFESHSAQWFMHRQWLDQVFFLSTSLCANHLAYATYFIVVYTDVSFSECWVYERERPHDLLLPIIGSNFWHSVTQVQQMNKGRRF